MEEERLEVYNKRERSTTTLYVERISETKFKMKENDFFNCELTFGTEFETRINKEGKHEIIRLAAKSEFITRRFFLNSTYTQSDYLMLGNELGKRGGFWQIDFGGIATVNIPKDFEFDIDQVMKDLDINLAEIVDDE